MNRCECGAPIRNPKGKHCMECALKYRKPRGPNVCKRTWPTGSYLQRMEHLYGVRP